MTDLAKHLVTFRDKLTDARKGFQQAAGDVDDPELRVLFTRAADEKQSAVVAIRPLLPPEHRDEGGTVIGAVTQVIVAARAAITGDDSLLPGMVDGERRVLKACDEALDAATGEPAAAAILERLRERIAELLATLEAHQSAAS